MHGFTRFIVAAVLLAVGAGPAPAETRIALVIGNAAYEHAPPLRKTLHDAADIAAALERLGFEVTRRDDQSFDGFRRTLQSFNHAASTAEVALVFYAGHAFAVDKQNFLVPVDARLASDQDAEYEAIPLELVLRSAQRARRLSLVILDACRDNPFVAAMIRAGGNRAIGHGLARVELTENTLVAFAARDGTTAGDGDGRNSPYTTVLLEHLERPGVELNTLLRQVRDAVMAATGARQEPFVYGTLSRETFYFVPPSEPARRRAKEAAPQLAQAPAKARKPDKRVLDLAFWKSIKDSEHREDFEKYLDQYPDGVFANVARRRRDELEEARVADVTPPTRPLRLPAGTTFRDCPECPEMVVVPAGTFMMGSPESEAGREAHEGPQHAVSIAEPFAMGKHEVTFAEWQACHDAGECGHLPGDRGWGRGNRPVIHVSWKDARDYVRWLSEKTGHTYRLPSETEWEYAARAGTDTIYWWGDEVGRNNANCSGCGSRWDNRQSAPVGSFAPNPFGLYDVLGNVWERVEDCYHDSYSGAPSDGSAWMNRRCRKHALRGGSWASIPVDVRSASRGSAGAGARVKLIGFRVARTLS